MLVMYVDPSCIPDNHTKELLQKTMSECGIPCDFIPQVVENTISWSTTLTAEKHVADIEKEAVSIIHSENVVKMISCYKNRQVGGISDGLTLTEWVESVQSALPGKNLTVLIVGLKTYFSKEKLNKKRQHKEAVTGVAAKGKKKTKDTTLALHITQKEAEEAFVETQLMTGCVLQQVDDDDDLVAHLKMLSKAICEKPSKKDRLNNVFSFLEEGTSGLSVSKNGDGLAKVWKHQLMQFKNFGAEMANALVSKYPSPLSLHQACMSCLTDKETEQMLGDINVRRGAGVVATNRRIGKEQARRIHQFMISNDPELVLK